MEELVRSLKKPTIEGCHIRGPLPADTETTCVDVLNRLGLTDLQPWVNTEAGMDELGPYVALRLDAQQARQWAPDLDTLGLAATMQLDSIAHLEDLTREIVVSMLMGPIAFEFPSVDELVSAVRIRINIVQAARKTTLAFHTSEAERPADFWRYDEDWGFVIRPGVSLCQALIRGDAARYQRRDLCFFLLPGVGICDPVGHCTRTQTL